MDGAHGDEDRQLEEVRALELRLLDPAVRRDRAQAARLLHPAFAEIGASGRIWDATSVLRALAEEPGEAAVVADLSVERLAPGVALATYRAEQPGTGRATLRASVWVCDAQGWRVRFHQGTPLAAGSAPQDGGHP